MESDGDLPAPRPQGVLKKQVVGCLEELDARKSVESWSGVET